MAEIYLNRNEKLYKLLKLILDPDGGRMLVPDLQRRFVWTPEKVILLVDSLIRGWPFGNLLTWKVRGSDLALFPKRAFWSFVDFTDENGNGALRTRKLPCEDYHMVLDGQQRLQSLLLAVGGDGFGCRMLDHRWKEALRGERTASVQHWSTGELVFDLDSFQEQYAAVKHIWAVDYRSILQWAVVSDASDGMSGERKPPNYVPALIDATAPENRGRYIRFSRIWNEVIPVPDERLTESDFQRTLKDFLPGLEVSSEKTERLLKPMAEFAHTLVRVKRAEVPYQELQPYEEELGSVDDYNNAIVNIFTRLNSAGTPLTKAEITFAWLKTYWNDECTGGRKASVCIGQLRESLRKHELAIEEDALVAAISIVWAVAFRNGEVLSDRDLLKGEVLSLMARDLSQNWSLLVSAAEEVTRQARKRDVVSVYQAYYKSLNPFAVLWAWRFLAARWWQSPNRGRTTDPIRNRFDEALGASLDEHMDRWLLCSHWAGMWAGSTSDAIARFARGLAGLHASLAQCHEWQQAIELLCNHLHSLVSGLQQGAAEHISALQVSRRADVKAYYSPLWVWHRLDERRWDVSRLTLRERTRATPKLEVDHIVAVEMWPQLVGTSEGDDLQRDVNALGNCMLLKSNFNRSKNKSSFGSFLERALDPHGPTTLRDVAIGLGLDKAQLYPEGADLVDLRRQTQERGKAVKQDLVDFVNGRKNRVDPPSRDS